MSQLNNYVLKRTIKFEDWDNAVDFFKIDCYLYKFDLKSGYHHIDIFRQQLTYFSFSWNNKFYCFSVLPFGLTSALYIFTRC